jgi:hypothetical protein
MKTIVLLCMIVLAIPPPVAANAAPGAACSQIVKTLTTRQRQLVEMRHPIGRTGPTLSILFLANRAKQFLTPRKLRNRRRARP